MKSLRHALLLALGATAFAAPLSWAGDGSPMPSRLTFSSVTSLAITCVSVEFPDRVSSPIVNADVRIDAGPRADTSPPISRRTPCSVKYRYR